MNARSLVIDTGRVDGRRIGLFRQYQPGRLLRPGTCGGTRGRSFDLEFIGFTRLHSTGRRARCRWSRKPFAATARS